jgi:hypothetical protein
LADFFAVAMLGKKPLMAAGWPWAEALSEDAGG